MHNTYTYALLCFLNVFDNSDIYHLSWTRTTDKWNSVCQANLGTSGLCKYGILFSVCFKMRLQTSFIFQFEDRLKVLLKQLII